MEMVSLRRHSACKEMKSRKRGSRSSWQPEHPFSLSRNCRKRMQGRTQDPWLGNHGWRTHWWASEDAHCGAHMGLEGQLATRNTSSGKRRNRQVWASGKWWQFPGHVWGDPALSRWLKWHHPKSTICPSLLHKISHVCFCRCQVLNTWTIVSTPSLQQPFGVIIHPLQVRTKWHRGDIIS